MTAKPVSERVQALRKRREAQGLARLELWADPEDHESIKVFAAKLQKKREKPITNLQAIRRGLIKVKPIGVIEASANPSKAWNERKK